MSTAPKIPALPPTANARLRRTWLLPALVGLVLGTAIGSVGIVPTLAQQGTAAPPGPTKAVAGAINPQESALYANLYVQTAAEYRAVCLQTYTLAIERLRQKFNAGMNSGKPPAVIMDMDETVFDNAGYQSFLDRERSGYSDVAWDDWEHNYGTEVRLVPGAKGFIEAAERMGVTVVYVSNRAKKNASGTISALAHNGLSTDNINDRLFLREETSSKMLRFARVEQQYRVMLYVGDNLRDFSDEYAAPKTTTDDDRRTAIAERFARVEAKGYRWGADWFILPNPVYGEWTRLLGDNPRRLLRPTGLRTELK